MRVPHELTLKKADSPADTQPTMQLLTNDRLIPVAHDRPATTLNDRAVIAMASDRPAAFLSDRPATAVTMRRLAFATTDGIQLLDVTDDIAAAVRSTGVRDGIVTIVSRHTTMAVRIQEAEPLLMEDLLNFLRRLAPSNVHYQHNDFRIRTHHMHDDESPNGHSHCLQFLLGTSETVPVMDGELVLGEWQRIFLVELDGPRVKREVLIQTIGTA
jgi:secondary thiamine-phosphate synthase enzyme